MLFPRIGVTLLFISLFYVQAHPPVDISFLIVDFKYNSLQGVKICEIQQSAKSKFQSYDSIYNHNGLIPDLFCHVIGQYQDAFWSIRRNIRSQLFIEKVRECGWEVFSGQRSYLSNADFIMRSSMPVLDPYDLTAYHGILYTNPSDIGPIDLFREKYLRAQGI